MTPIELTLHLLFFTLMATTAIVFFIDLVHPRKDQVKRFHPLLILTLMAYLAWLAMLASSVKAQKQADRLEIQQRHEQDDIK